MTPPVVAVPYLNPTVVEADIAAVLPVISFFVDLFPGTTGEVVVSVLTALSNPAVVGPVVDLINQLDGAVPPTT